jgi:D-lactate dehydrogenase
MGEVLVAEATDEEVATLRAGLHRLGVAVEVRGTPAAVRGPDLLGPGVEVLSVFIGSTVGVAEVTACPDLRLVATRSTGVDHIDLAACAERGIAVANVPAYGENTVAEHTFALILSLSRNVHKAWMRTRRSDFSLAGLRGFDLRGRTIGLVGTGRIGLHVAKIARGFGMEVLAVDVRPQPLLAEVIGFRYCPLDELVSSSDIVSLHVPLLPATHHLVDRDLLKRFRRGSLLINTSRGGLVDTQALLWALDEGIVAGAGLDVLEGEHTMSEDRRRLLSAQGEEPLRTWFGNHLLIEREDVVVTPHIAFDSAEAVARILEVTSENIAGFRAGTPQNLVPVA